MEYPKLRAIEAIPLRRGGRVLVQLHDPMRISQNVALVPGEMMYLLALFDGAHSITDIQTALARRFGEFVPGDQIQRVLAQLDEALLLDSDRFREHLRAVRKAFAESPVRLPCGSGTSYPEDRDELRALLDSFFAADGGPGRPRPATADGGLVGVVAPHIDFERGAPSYAHAYKVLAEGTRADVFVIFGTAHFAHQAPYILTRKSFQTPLGTLPTAADLVGELARRYGREPFAEELVHKTEHSIEFQVLLLQHVLQGREAEILPILCGSMEGLVGEERSPREVAAIGDFLEALRDVVAGSGRRACAIAGADLAHVGHQFGDDFPLSAQVMADVEHADRATLEHVQQLDPDGFYANVALDDNARHICGVPPIYALLAVTDASRCELLDYRQAVDYDLQRAVTFASLALYA